MKLVGNWSRKAWKSGTEYVMKQIMKAHSEKEVMLQEMCNGFEEVKRRVQELRLTTGWGRSRWVWKAECDRVIFSRLRHKYGSVSFVLLTFSRADPKNNSLVTDWHLKPALTTVITHMSCHIPTAQCQPETEVSLSLWREMLTEVWMEIHEDINKCQL